MGASSITITINPAVDQFARVLGMVMAGWWGWAFVSHPLGGTVVAPYPLPLNFGT